MTADSDLLLSQVLESAFALPAALYTKPQIAERERTAVFARHWQLVAHAGQVRDAGDHAILLGRVVRFARHEAAGAPLVYFQGRYGALAQGTPPDGIAGRRVTDRD